MKRRRRVEGNLGGGGCEEVRDRGGGEGREGKGVRVSLLLQYKLRKGCTCVSAATV